MNKFIAALIFIIILSISGCGNNKVPTLEEASKYSEDEFRSLAAAVSEKDLINKWGEPSRPNNSDIWELPVTGGRKFMTAEIENGRVITIGLSYSLFVTAADIVGNTVYGTVGWDGYSDDVGTLTVLPKNDCFGNEIEYNVGDVYYFQFDGRIMETYPAQINSPYSAELMGHLSDDEIKDLNEKIVLP